MQNGNEHLDTRDRLLEGAAQVFADKGFDHATHREICDRAEANIAAINYYFGSKEELYREAWKKAFTDLLRRFPADGGIDADAPPEERLRGRICSFILKICDPENQAFLIVHKEMALATELLQEVMHECIQPLHMEMKSLLREILGPEIPDKAVSFCMAGIISQCLGTLCILQIHKCSDDNGLPLKEFLKDNIDEYIEHVYRFSLAGIQNARERYSQDRTI